MLFLLSFGKTFANTCKCFSRFSNGTSTLSNDSTILLCPGSSTSIAPNIITFSNDVFEWQSSLNPGVVISNSSTLNVTADNDCDYILTITRGTGELQKALSFVFHIILKPVPVMDMPVNACDTYTWPINNTTYTSNAEVTVYGGASNNGCDSIYNLHLTINNSQHNVIDESKCDSYIWHGTNYTQSGTFTYSYISDNNCLSTDTLKLQITNSTHNAYTVTSCGDYTWNGNIYNSSSTETYSYTNSSNCPSTDTLHLTVNQPTNDTITVSACDSYNFFGTEYTNTTNRPIFTYPGGNWKGCDSTIHLHLTILGHKLGTDTRTACESFTWRCNNETYTTSTNGITASGGADADGCDSIITLNLTINHGTHNVESLATCSTYSWHGQNYPNSGTYTYSYVNSQACPSTDTLRLTVNDPSSSTTTASACDSYNFFGTEYTSTTNSPTFTYPGGNWKGCDSTIHLHLTILGHKLGTDTRTACESFTWRCNNETYTTSTNGITASGGADADGCDSIITLNLTINHGTHNVESLTTCSAYSWHGQNYPSSGTYTYSYVNAQNCPSTDTLRLTVNSPSSSTTTASACDSYNFFGTEYTSTTSSPTFTYPGGNWKGCDSTINLHLTILGHKSGTDTRTACESYTWRCNNETYFTSANGITASGGADADGCDSLITLNLTINHGTHNAESVTTCSAYSWHGQNYPSSGTYTYSYVNSQACPSTDTLHLTVNSPSSSTITASACDSYNFFGTEYTSTTNSPTFTYPGGNWKGCDSTINLHLTILGHELGTDSPIECDSYSWFRNGVTYTTSISGVQVFGGVDANGCDSIITLNLTLNHGQFNAETINACDSYQWNDNTYTSSGSYTHYSTNSNGCTDTAVLTLNITESIHNTYHKTACKSYDWDVNGNGQSHFTSSGTYLDYWSANGCENSDTLVLTILDYEVPSIETLVQKKHKGTTNPWMLIYPRSADDGKYYYQWYRNDSLINGADKQYFQLPQESPGNQVTYSVMVSSNPMAYCATISSATITFVANKSTSVNTTPNPNNGTFTIGLSSTYHQAIKAEFYNTYGTLIAEIPLVDNLANIEGLLPQGVYFVRITTTTGECFTDKVIIR